VEELDGLKEGEGVVEFVRDHLQELERSCWGLGGLCVWSPGKGKRKGGCYG